MDVATGSELLKVLVELGMTPTQLGMLWLLWSINGAFNKLDRRITILETIIEKMGGKNG